VGDLEMLLTDQYARTIM